MTTTAGRRPRAEHLGPERRRPQVLDAALEIAASDGLGAVTVGTVADRMHVTRPVVYACFRDRIELITALLDRETEMLTSMALDALHSARADDMVAAFVAGYQALLTAVAQRPDAWRLVFSTGYDPEVAARVAAARAHVAGEASAWIGPTLTSRWHIAAAERKQPMLIELFVSSCEAAVRLLLASPEPDGAGRHDRVDELSRFFGNAMYHAFASA
ncbi:TetR/AcrR family transcriptional regulator [Tsukamurella soli]|uniref:HTH tetR-type domain-containing protein n=1 Tax=Tsukamurella soli TaxID=644556 RepID=A0ABP8JAF8_9ACTN